ncbi:putative transcriptional regulator, AraC family protein [Actinorhabdospora filicis]|uniref:Transcriptional regulator, AraC family protein n=1 Tax=Actinorhabdospora filicis TaxID=1785913 RepID=A0A9W6W590_9ACTN|nr:AraC family transcriptional regulator [Actinorhabdospora filicis]GLZ80122.1 putative transcriptional regulator, AraC family protein [Actinorhabdospora filicis]
MTAWTGDVRMYPGLLAFTGRIGPADAHAHACLQLLVPTAGTVRLTGADGATRTVTGAAIIPAGVAHRVHADAGATGLAAYIEADSPAGRAATAKLRATGELTDVRTWLTAAGHTTPAPRPARHSAWNPVLDAAVRAAVAAPGGPPSLTALAAAVAISPDRLGRLFAGHMGLSYPVWRRWIRLQRAMGAARAGENLTRSAHLAGFADSAHLSRTVRSMFGITAGDALAATGWR